MSGLGGVALTLNVDRWTHGQDVFYLSPKLCLQGIINYIVIDVNACIKLFADDTSL